MNDTIVDEIKKYMENPLEYAILLDGMWGTGKTYFVKNKLKGIETIYISLNGINNISNIVTRLIYEILVNEKLLKGKEHKLKKLSTNAVSALGNVLAPIMNNKLNFSIEDFLDLIKGVEFTKSLIVFDDLERCKLPIEESLGFINTLVEHNQIKVLIVANESELQEKEKYNKIKEKLIYQSFKYEPELKEIYSMLTVDKATEIIENKDFVICELERKQHYNIRTMKFVFQRYKELKMVIEKVIESENIDDVFKKQVYTDVFKYMLVISRDYKMGEEINNFSEDAQLSYYILKEGSYDSITSFRFVDEFVIGLVVNEEKIKNTIKSYVKELKGNEESGNSALNILNRWWETEDEEINIDVTRILKALDENTYVFDLYPKILLFFVRIVCAGFSKGLLDSLLDKMKANIDASSENVTLGHRILDAKLSETEEKMYKEYKIKLDMFVDNHNELLNSDGISLVEENSAGKMGEYIYSWCTNNKSIIIGKKKFLDIVGMDNIIYIIENGNANDIRYLIYLFNEIYRYANVKELYPADKQKLQELKEMMKKYDVSSYSKMKKFNFESLMEDLDEFIERLN